MSVLRVLALAEWLCGTRARHTVFDPLVADWQREWHGARSTVERARIACSGATALLLSMVCYTLAGGPGMPRRTILTALMVLAISSAALLAAQIALNSAQFSNDFPFEMRIWTALPMVLPFTVPLALLGLMMRVRAVQGMTGRDATLLIVAGALLAIVTTGWLTPLAQGDVRDELHEAMYQRNLANDQAGRVHYPATAVRQIRMTTAEDRVRLREAFRQNPGYLAAQAERTRPRWNRPTFMSGALALAMGAFGWTLGGLGRTSVAAAAGWFALSWMTLMVTGGRFLYSGPGASQYLGRGPDWLPVAVFGVAATALLFATRRVHGR